MKEIKLMNQERNTRLQDTRFLLDKMLGKERTIGESNLDSNSTYPKRPTTSVS